MLSKETQARVVAAVLVLIFCIQGNAIFSFGSIGNTTSAGKTTPVRNNIESKNTLGTSPGIQSSGGGVNTFPMNLEYSASDSLNYSNWSIPSGWTKANVTMDYHLTSLKVTGSSGSAYRMFKPIQTGYVEFYLLYIDNQPKDIELNDSLSNGGYIKLHFNGSVFQCYNNGYQDGRFGPCTIALNTWHFIRIEFDCLPHDYYRYYCGLGKDPLWQYRFNVWVDSVLQFKNFPMSGTPANLSEILVQHQGNKATTFLDAVEFSSQPGHKDIIIGPGESLNVTAKTFQTLNGTTINAATEVVHNITVIGGNLTFNCKGLYLHVDGMISVTSTATMSGNLTLLNGSTIDSRDGLKYSGFFDAIQTPDHIYGDEKDSDLCIRGLQEQYGTPLPMPILTISGNSVLRCDGFWCNHANITMSNNATLKTTYFFERNTFGSRFNATNSTIISDKSFDFDDAGFFDGLENYTYAGPTQYYLYLSNTVLNASFVWLEGGTSTAIAKFVSSTINGMLWPDGGSSLVITGTPQQKSKIMFTFLVNGGNAWINNTVIGINVDWLTINYGSVGFVRPRWPGDPADKNISSTSVFQNYFVDVGPGATETENNGTTGYCPNVTILKNGTYFRGRVVAVNCSTPKTGIFGGFLEGMFNSSLIWTGMLEFYVNVSDFVNCDFHDLSDEFSNIATIARTTYSWKLNCSAISNFMNSGTFFSNLYEFHGDNFTFVNCWFCSDYKLYFGWNTGSQSHECLDWGYGSDYNNQQYNITYIDCHINPATQVQFFDKNDSNFNVMFINASGNSVSYNAWNARKSRYVNYFVIAYDGNHPYFSAGLLGILGKQITCIVRLPTNCSHYNMSATCSASNETRTISDGKPFTFNITSDAPFTITLQQNLIVMTTRRLKPEVVYLPYSPTLNPITPTPSHNGTLYLSWTISPDAKSYALYRSTSNITVINDSVTSLGTFTTTSIKDTLMNNGKYYYVVTALNASGESPPSNCVSGIVNSTITPTPGPEPSPWTNPLVIGGIAAIAGGVVIVAVAVGVSRKRKGTRRSSDLPKLTKKFGEKK